MYCGMMSFDLEPTVVGRWPWSTRQCYDL